MRHKISIVYSWLVRVLLYFLPNHPLVMRFRGACYSLMMKECGKNFQVSSSVVFNSLASMEIGDNVYIAYNTVFIGVNIIIKDDVIIGPNCVISGGNHVFDGQSFRFSPSVQGTVIINNGSWIAGNCTILSDTEFPAKSILAAGATLTKNFLNEESIYAGVPAKRIKSI